MEVLREFSKNTRYVITSSLGKGGGGEVYLAYDNSLERYVAIKFYLGIDEKLKKKFLKEAKIQAQLENEYICDIYEVGEVAGATYIVMKYIKGYSIHELVNHLSINEKVELMLKIVSVLKIIHALGIVHRDIKPSNIMVEEDEKGRKLKPYLMDFGIAKEIGTKGETITGEIIGSPYFMSPEQVAGDMDKLDRRSDIYSFGATLYYFLSGRKPFDNFDSLAAVMYATLNEEPIPLSKLKRDIPSDLEAIVSKCMEKDPEKRYNTAQELEDDLKRFLAGDPVLAKNPNFFERLKKRVKKRKLFYSSLLIFHILIITISILYLRAIIIKNRNTYYLIKINNLDDKLNNFIIAGYLSPCHDITQTKKELLESMKSLLSYTNKLSGKEKAYGYFTIGKNYFLLGEIENSIRFFKMAWGINKDPSYSNYIGLCYLVKSLNFSEKINEYRNEYLKKKKKLVFKKYLDKSSKFFMLSKVSNKDEMYFKRGAIEFINGEYKSAIKNFRKINSKNILIYYYSIFLTAKCYENLIFNSKNERNINRYFKKAKEILEKGIDFERSNPLCYTEMANLFRIKMFISIYGKGKQVEKLFSKSEEYLNKAIQIDPYYKRSYIVKCYLYFKYCEYLSLKMDKRREKFSKKGLNFAKKAFKLFPKSAELANSLMVFYILQIAYLSSDKTFDKYVSEAKKYVKIIEVNFPENIHLKLTKAKLLGAIGITKYYFNRNAISELKDAISIFNEVIDNPDNFIFESFSREIDRYFLGVELYMWNGINPIGLYLKSINEIIKLFNSKKIFGGYPIYVDLGQINHFICVYSIWNGKKFEKFYKDSLKFFKKAEEINSNYFFSYILQFELLSDDTTLLGLKSEEFNKNNEEINRLKSIIEKKFKNIFYIDFVKLYVKKRNFYLTYGNKKFMKEAFKKFINDKFFKKFEKFSNLKKYKNFEKIVYPIFIYLDFFPEDKNVWNFLDGIYESIKKFEGKRYFSDRAIILFLLRKTSYYLRKKDLKNAEKCINESKKILSNYKDEHLQEIKLLTLIVNGYSNKNSLKIARQISLKNRFLKLIFSPIIDPLLKYHTYLKHLKQ